MLSWGSLGGCGASLVKREIHYLNTDLDLVSRETLEPLATTLGTQGLFVLHVAQRKDLCWYATLETDEQFRQPEPNILAFLAAIESLDPEAEALWQACTAREFNIGYDCGDAPWAFNHALTAPTLARVAALGASLRITLYPVDSTSARRAVR